jgi:hypothetical protein
MDIGEIIRKLVGGEDPNAAIMGAQGAAPPGPPPVQQAAPPPPQPTAPQGAATPVTNPIPPAAQPKALQSPSDLANMYVALMEKNQNAARLDSGLNLIAAGLSNSPTNRAALISASGHGGSGGMSLSANDMINFQKQADAQKQQLIMQQALPALIKQYKLSPAQAAALQASGNLGDVIKTYSTEQLGHVEDKETGKTILFNQRTGQKLAELGGETPEEGQFVDGPNGPVLKSKRIPDDGITTPVGLKPTNNKQQFDEFNAALVAQGKPPISPEDFLKMLHPSQSVTVNNKDNAPYQAPEKGYDYVRNQDNSVKVGPDGKPTLYKIPGGSPEEEAANKAKEEAKKLTDEQKKELKSKIHANLTSTAIGSAVDTALGLVDKPGATGFGSRWARSLSPGGTPADNIDAQLSSLKANVALETLKGLREASKTGASGLGAVTDFEQKMLASVFGPLETYQSGQNIKPTLARIKAAMELLATDDYDNKTDPAAATSKFMADLHRRTDEILAKELSGKGPIKVEVRPR